MLDKLPKRVRLITMTAGVGMLFLIATTIVLWTASRTGEVYKPGEDVEGLTSDLARSLPPDYPKVKFVDVAAQAGIKFKHFYGRRSTQLPEDMGSGLAWGDYDNDGWQDLFVVNHSGPLTMSASEIENSPAKSALYHNNGDGTFSDVAGQSGLALNGWGMAAAWADYDNDGNLDLFVSAYGKNRFFKNLGNGVFKERTDESGLGNLTGFWAGASWSDYDRDGYLDLYVCGYVKYTQSLAGLMTRQYDVEVPASINPSSFEPERNLLYHNKGDGTFSEVAATAGVLGEKGRSLSAAWCDFDEDGWPDLYVANDVSDNVFYRNLGNGSFEDLSHAAWVADYRGAMGIAIGDWDGDTDFDMFVTHWIAQENALYSNLQAQLVAMPTEKKDLRFMDESDRYGLGQIALDYIGWGTSFFDYDNDGRLDLFVANGSTFQEPDKPWLLIAMPNLLFWNKGSRDGFFEVSGVAGKAFTEARGSRGAAFADYDNDGDLDIAILNNLGQMQLLRNDGGNRGNWLKVALKGTRSNRNAIGARLRLVAGDKQQVRYVGGQSSYCSQNSLVQHFGLGKSAQIDTLEVLWPSGVIQRFATVATNRTVLLTEEQSVPLYLSEE